MKKRTWIIVADGASARVFENIEKSGKIDLIWQHESEEARKPTRELGTDQPGSSQASGGMARHGFANKVDWHDAAKQEFIHKLAGKLNVAARRNRFDQLVLIAAPKPLGQLRGELTGPAAAAIAAELAKDLTGLTEHQLPDRIDKLFPL